MRQEIIPKKDGGAYVVLLVEDQDVNQIMGRTLLEKMGCEVTIASDGAKAVELFKNNTFDIIFMDCKMPGMDGYEATKAIRIIESERGDGRSTPVVALTSKVMTGDRAACISAGMDDYIPKPIRKEAVCTMINKWCGTYIDYKEMW